MEKVKLAAPWTIYYRQIQALFAKDPQIKVVFDEGAPAVKLLVDNTAKADALMSVLPMEKTFGNIALKIVVVPSNNKVESTGNPIVDLFTGNDALAFFQAVDLMTITATFVVFKKEVVQFFNDNMGDIYGICSTLYENLARELLGDAMRGVYYCTDIDNASAPKFGLGAYSKN